MGSFARVLTGTAAVYRSPAESGGVVAAMSLHIGALAVSERLPVDGQWILRVPQLAQFAKAWQLFAEDADVRVGDHLQIDGVRYPVHGVERWPWRPGEFYLNLAVQELA